MEDLTVFGVDRRARLVGILIINCGLALLLAFVYLSLVWLLPMPDLLTAHAIATVVVALCVAPARRRLIFLANHLRGRGWQDARALLRDTTESLGRTIDPEDLRELLTTALPGRLRLDGAAIWMLYPPDDYAFVALGDDPLAPGATILTHGSSAGYVRQSTLPIVLQDDDVAEWIAPFRLYQLRLVLPLHIGGRLVGIYACGAPRNGGAYPQLVLDLLSTLAPAIASALENARAYSEIAHLNEQLRTFDRRKASFIEHVGHELRTPLTSLTLALQVASARPDLLPNLLSLLGNSAAQLTDLVERVLEFDDHLHPVAPGAETEIVVELLPLLHALCTTYTPLAHAKGIAITVDVSAETVVAADGHVLRRALHEIVDNALRYSDAGAVTISATTSDGLTVLRVTDQGPGVPADERDQLFALFFRSRKVRALADTPGSGLGLSLARRDIELLGGRIWIGQTGPQGTEICLALPAAALLSRAVGEVAR